MEVRVVRVLRSLQAKSGHFPGCAHSYWIGTWTNQTRHDCDVTGCHKEGAPCSERCRNARVLLRELERAVETQGAA